MDKIPKIRSQPAENIVFCGTEASSIISSVTQYRITKNCDSHTRGSSFITIRITLGKKKIIMLFQYHNMMETGFPNVTYCVQKYHRTHLPKVIKVLVVKYSCSERGYFRTIVDIHSAISCLYIHQLAKWVTKGNLSANMVFGNTSNQNVYVSAVFSWLLT